MHVGQSHVRSSSLFFGELEIAFISFGATCGFALCPVTAFARLARRICAFRRFTMSASERAASYMSLLVYSLAVSGVFYESFLFTDVTLQLP